MIWRTSVNTVQCITVEFCNGTSFVMDCICGYDLEEDERPSSSWRHRRSGNNTDDQHQNTSRNKAQTRPIYRIPYRHLLRYRPRHLLVWARNSFKFFICMSQFSSLSLRGYSRKVLLTEINIQHIFSWQHINESKIQSTFYVCYGRAFDGVLLTPNKIISFFWYISSPNWSKIRIAVSPWRFAIDQWKLGFDKVAPVFLWSRLGTRKNSFAKVAPCCLFFSCCLPN